MRTDSAHAEVSRQYSATDELSLPHPEHQGTPDSEPASVAPSGSELPNKRGAVRFPRKVIL